MPEPATLPRSGLFTKAEVAVPLAGVSVEAEISYLCARVVVTQRFVNREDSPIEAVYLFPLDEGAAVCGFEAIVDGTLVIGEVKEREDAFRAYDDAMERGDGAFLLDEERPDVFQASVGNLPPGREILLKLTYVTDLAVNGGAVRFVIPTTVSPRYAPAEDQIGIGRPDSETLNPPAAWTVPYGLDLTVHVAMSEGVGRVESPSHPIAIALDGARTTVTLSQRDAALDRDFVLAMESKALETPRAWIERGDDGRGAVAIAFVPNLPETQAPAEVVFLVDRSGSMDGTSIEEVRNALQLCLRSMTAGCRFNVIGFGSSTDALFPESRGYDETTLQEASAYVAALEANLGGTELLPALRLALEAPRHASLARQVVVFTDGEVSNTDAVLALAGQHASRARIFTFGIGAGASHHLVKGLARAAGGSAEFIYPGERIEPKVVRQFERLLSPALTNVRVDWSGLDATQAPSTVPPVFAGGRLLVYGFLRSDPKPGTAASVRLTADGPAGPVAFGVQVNPDRATSGASVATLAARARIRELEESPEWTTARGSRQRQRKESGVTREIIELAIRYGLVSRETSYVAVERRETPVLGDVQLRRVPIALTTGWGGGERDRLRAAHVRGFTGAYRLGATRPDAALSLGTPQFSRFGVFEQSVEGDVTIAPCRSSALGPQGAEFLYKSPHARRFDAMHALVVLQHAEGWWALTPEIAAIVGYDLQLLESVVRHAKGDAGEARAAWATALALAWLEAHASGVEDQWRLLARKARAWLQGVSAAAPDNAGWLRTAEEFMRTAPSQRRP